MRVNLIGGDARFGYAAGELARRGHDVFRDAKGEFDVAAAVRAEDLADVSFRKGIVQRGTGTDDIVSLENDEEYLQENAMLTAEGALYHAMGEGKAIFGKNCLVIGYGRIGRALYRMLESMGANVFAAVRAGKSCSRARRDHAQILSMEEMRAKIGDFDLVWNTAPETVLYKEDLACVKPEAGLFELASAPYGFDLELARSLDIWAELLPALPGKYAPRAAGLALARAMLRRMEEME